MLCSLEQQEHGRTVDCYSILPSSPAEASLTKGDAVKMWIITARMKTVFKDNRKQQPGTVDKLSSSLGINQKKYGCYDVML